MAITFPVRTGPPPPGVCYRPAPGTPTRAQHCECAGGPVTDEPDGTCILCGHFPAEVVSLTWQHRAQAIARARQRRAA